MRSAGRSLGPLGIGQRTAVDLAVRSPWQRGEDDEDGRDEEGGEAGFEVAAEDGGQVADRRIGRHHPGDEPQAPGDLRALRARRDHGLGHGRMRGESGLDLPRLDAEAADLHLLVQPAEESEPAVRPQAGEVARAIEARPGGPPGVGPEPLRRRLRPPEIAAGEPGAADPDLSRYSRRHRLQTPVEQDHPLAREGPADGRRPLPSPDLRPRRVHRRLGGAVEVADPPPGGGESAGEGLGERLAGKVDGAHRCRQGVRAHQLRRDRGDGVHQGHPVTRRQVRQRQGVPGEDDRAAAGERHEQLEKGEIEAGRGGGEHTGDLGVGVGPIRPGKQGGDAPLRDPHPLGAAGRARGVDLREEAVGTGGERRRV